MAFHQTSLFVPSSNTSTSQQLPPSSSKKRSRQIQQQPTFCDPTASVTPLTFGARRLPEIKELYNSSCCTFQYPNKNHGYLTTPTPTIKPNITTTTSLLKSYTSGGKKTSCRHLRKRATSHKPRNRYRIIQSTTTATTTKGNSITTNHNKDNSNHVVDDENTNILTTTTNSSFVDRSSTASTTTIINMSRRKLRKNPNALLTMHGTWRQQQQQLTGKSHGVHSFQEKQHALQQDFSKDSSRNTKILHFEKSKNNNNNKKNTTNWLVTHLWHTKRFHMMTLWNWRIPMLHTNRGTQATLRLVTEEINTKTTTTTQPMQTTLKQQQSDKYEYDINQQHAWMTKKEEANTSSSTSLTTVSKCLIQDATWCMQPIWFRINIPPSQQQSATNDIQTTGSSSSKNQSSSIGGVVMGSSDTYDSIVSAITRIIPNFTIQSPRFIQNDHGTTVTTGSNNATTMFLQNTGTVSYGGESMVHEMDQFPRRPIGPITWLCTNQELLATEIPSTRTSDDIITQTQTMNHDGMDDDASMKVHADRSNQIISSTLFFLYFWVHPSIQQDVHELFQRVGVVFENNNSNIITSIRDGDNVENCTDPLNPLLLGSNNNQSNQPIQVRKTVAEGPIDGIPDTGCACLKIRGNTAAFVIAYLLERNKYNYQRHHRNKDNKEEEDVDNNKDNVKVTPVTTTKRNLEYETAPSNVAQSNQILFKNWSEQHHNELTFSQEQLRSHHLTTWSTSIYNTGVSSSTTITIRRIVPRSPILTCNYGVCGYDIFCSPNIVKDLFLQCILMNPNNNGVCCCPIGYVDEVTLQLECEPPLPTFPRDYPDVPEGKKYWNEQSFPSTITTTAGVSTLPSSQLDQQNEQQQEPWKIVRAYWEGGGGRIRLPDNNAIPNSLPQLLSPEFVMHSDADVRTTDHPQPVPTAETTESFLDPIVVVRGAFGEPFQQALDYPLQSMIRIPPPTHSNGKQKRRRSGGEANDKIFTTFPPLPREIRDIHYTFCTTLATSLSLPAVLVCHLHIIGKGRIIPGSPLYFRTFRTECDDNFMETTRTTERKEDSNLLYLGYCSTGSFSVARGRYHGIGLISAARFLKSILTTETITPSTTATKHAADNDSISSKTDHNNNHVRLLVGKNHLLMNKTTIVPTISQRKMFLPILIQNNERYYEGALNVLL